MHILRQDMDPQIAEQIGRVLPTVLPRPAHRPNVRQRLSRRRKALLLASIVVPPLVSLYIATHSYWSGNPWFFWITWLGLGGSGTIIGCRQALRGRFSLRQSLIMFIALIAPPLVGFFLANEVWNASHSTALAYALWLTVWFGGSYGGSLASLRATTQRPNVQERIGDLTVAEMQEVFSHLSLTRAERLYCDVLLFLGRTEADSETEATMRDTLRQLNAVLTSSRHLENRRRSLLPLMGANVLSELQAEYMQLKHRRDKTADAISRAALDHSLDIVTTRMDNARNLEVGLERLNVQQEVIAQTLASALSSLARMQVMSEHSADHTAHSAVQNITQTVTQLNQQTVAIEQAVQEVMTLTASG